jgi:hypothetical protein
MLNKLKIIIFLKDIFCRFACDPSINVCSNYTNTVNSRFYNLCKQNGFQLDAALTKIVDDLVVDELYIKFLNDHSVGIDEYEDNLFTYVMNFCGFFMIHNIQANSAANIRDKFIDLYK